MPMPVAVVLQVRYPLIFVFQESD